MQFLIGTGKSQIICFKKNIGMMGYGMSSNTVQDTSTEISARSLWIEDNSKNVFVYTCAEICFVTPAIRREVLSRITSELDPDFDPAYLMLSAQHTHSAPGGYSEYALYNFTIPGFHQEVFDGIVNGIFESIKQAYSSLEPGTMDLVEHQIESESAIAWNRSLDAYNKNPENTEVGQEDTHLAIDNRMRIGSGFTQPALDRRLIWFLQIIKDMLLNTLKMRVVKWAFLHRVLLVMFRHIIMGPAMWLNDERSRVRTSMNMPESMVLSRRRKRKRLLNLINERFLRGK